MTRNVTTSLSLHNNFPLDVKQQTKGGTSPGEDLEEELLAYHTGQHNKRSNEGLILLPLLEWHSSHISCLIPLLMHLKTIMLIQNPS